MTAPRKPARPGSRPKPPRSSAGPAADELRPLVDEGPTTGIKTGTKSEMKTGMAAPGAAHDLPVRVIVKVARANYVPAHASLRARLSPKLFTADTTAAALALLERDPDVVAVSPAKPLRST